MKNEIPHSRLDELLGHVLSNNESDVRTLLYNNGVAGASSLSGTDLHIAFLKAVKDSPSFRSSVSGYLTSFIGKRSMHSFIGQPMSGEFLNEVTDPLHPTGTVSAPNITSAYGGSSIPTISTDSPSMNGGSSFWDTLGGVVTTDNLNKLFNTGLTVLSTKLTSDANKQSEQAALKAKALELQIAQANAVASSQKAASGKIPTVAIVLLSLLGVGGIITAIVIASKKK